MAVTTENTLTTATIHTILQSMTSKAALVNMTKRDGQYAENIRECPWHSELYGMEHMLKLMGVEYEFYYDATVQYITGIQINDEYMEVC